jgi:hypothetical protein
MENNVIKTAPVHNKVSQLRRIFVYVLQSKFWRQDDPPQYTARRVLTQLHSAVRITGLLIPTSRKLSLKLN